MYLYFSSIGDGEPARSVPISRTCPLFAAAFAVLGLGENRTVPRRPEVITPRVVVGTLAIAAGGAILVW